MSIVGGEEGRGRGGRRVRKGGRKGGREGGRRAREGGKEQRGSKSSRCGWEDDGGN